jgi:hypothetical protein
LIGKVKPQLASMRRFSSAYSKHLVSSMCSTFGDVVHELILPVLPVERLLDKWAGGKFMDKSQEHSVTSSQAGATN